MTSHASQDFAPVASIASDWLYQLEEGHAHLPIVSVMRAQCTATRVSGKRVKGHAASNKADLSMHRQCHWSKCILQEVVFSKLAEYCKVVCKLHVRGSSQGQQGSTKYMCIQGTRCKPTPFYCYLCLCLKTCLAGCHIAQHSTILLQLELAPECYFPASKAPGQGKQPDCSQSTTVLQLPFRPDNVTNARQKHRKPPTVSVCYKDKESSSI